MRLRGAGRGGGFTGRVSEQPPIGSDQQAARSLFEPAEERLALDHPRRAEVLAAHRAAVEAGEPGYLDPETGLFVMTAAYLASRGTCCGSGCRHCPFV